jgi:protein gp37
MAELTGIAWTDHTYNPSIGCTKVSPGCDRCYAEAAWDKRYHRVQWGGERSRTKSSEPQTWDRKAREAGVRRRVFCASLADVFDNQVPDEWRADLWALIARCRALDWMLLTKRPQNITRCCRRAGPGGMCG